MFRHLSKQSFITVLRALWTFQQITMWKQSKGTCDIHISNVASYISVTRERDHWLNHKVSKLQSDNVRLWILCINNKGSPVYIFSAHDLGVLVWQEYKEVITCSCYCSDPLLLPPVLWRSEQSFKSNRRCWNGPRDNLMF